ncbi:hypothetical protein BTUL_0088g00610 [Botrytis tulipae]|uniref:Uncharacterized protein n=1 Tax=Botrytis tulipae TaxID=87230 RepID=A0A4Z1EQ32_9HELO|nr:hypothetical protein BTUL_0088g00610 [Botrytis tulipae]
MAEAFGVAGSAVGIISLALQLGDGILKLKSFWNAVKDAPEEILYILDELDITHVLLTEIEDSLGSQTISPAAARSLQLCQKGVDILNNAVKELEDEMKRRKKWGGIKMVMKKELLEKMEKRLGRANSLMMMAHQNYIASLSKSRHDEQVRLATQQFSEMVEIRNTLHSFNSAASIVTTHQQTSINTATSSITSSGNTTSCSRSIKPLSKHQKILNAKLRLPFFSGVWEVCAYQQSKSGWMFTLRTYNVVDFDAPIMNMARFGDVTGMQQLFQTRQASPFDVAEDGETLLHVGARNKSYDVCRFLVEQDVDVNIEDRWGQLLMGVFEVTSRGNTSEKIIDFHRHEEYFINSLEIWLDQIASAGIDLIEYGQWEKKTYDVDRFCGNIYFRGHYYAMSLFSFTYGSKRSDWQFWFTIEPECIHKGSVKEFWDMVENPERRIPGAWNFDA